jgi:predicted enzyme related to lactoylglutathione lyase
MITGAHFLIYSRDADADRVFFREVLDLDAVDAGGGWLIFALPPAEIAVHPGDGTFVQKHGRQAIAGIILYLMCDDISTTMAELRGKRVKCTAPATAPWGIYTLISLPSGAKIGLYQPTHPVAIGRKPSRRRAGPTL